MHIVVPGEVIMACIGTGLAAIPGVVNMCPLFCIAVADTI